MKYEDLEGLASNLAAKYGIKPEIKILSSKEIDRIDERMRYHIGPRHEPTMIAETKEKPTIFIEKTALEFFSSSEFKGKLAHEYSHLLAKELKYKDPILKVYREYVSALPFQPYPRLLDILSMNLWESCADQLVISHGLNEDLYRLRKRQLHELLNIRWPRKFLEYYKSFEIALFDCYVLVPFRLFQLPEEEMLYNLLVKLKRLQGVKEKIIKKYDEFLDCVTLKNPPTEQGVRNCFEKMLDLYELSS
jgi:hypothetical protein